MTFRKGEPQPWNSDPGYRARHAEGVKRNWQDPDFRARQAEGVKAYRKSRANPKRREAELIEAALTRRTGRQV